MTSTNDSERELKSRRQFMTRTGLVAVATALPSALFAKNASAFIVLPKPSSNQVIANVLHRLVFDTFSGLLAFVAPGNDCYSVAQGGLPLTKPGGALANSLEEDLVDCELNGNFLALQHLVNTQPILPIDFLRTQIQVLTTALRLNPISLPISGIADSELIDLDEALDQLLDEGTLTPQNTGCQTLPPVGLSSSLLSSLLLNLVATLVDPSTLTTDPPPGCGAPVTPFARLSFNDKETVFEELDRFTSNENPVLSALLGPSLLGLLSLLGSGLLSAAAMVSYSEASNLDVQRLTETGQVDLDLSRPVSGWDLSNYQKHQRGGVTVYDTVHGWDVFGGYWEGRTEATG